MDFVAEIKRLKKEKNAVILAHIYQRPEIQDIADYVGDSLGLAQTAATTEADMIVFCGVRFMAETAAITSPQKKVLLPEIHASCPMALMAKADDVVALKEQHPGAVVVTYVNSTASVKAVSDICCTSSNAINVVNSIKEDDIIFVPDRNLGSYVAEQIPEKNIILWDGFCPTHERINKEDIIKLKEKYPDAKVLTHPECTKEVRDISDFLGSTSQIIDFAKSDDSQKYIICTEDGVLHQMKINDPNKEYIIVSQEAICPNMKLTTLDKVYTALKEEKYHIIITDEIADKARKAIEKMLVL